MRAGCVLAAALALWPGVLAGSEEVVSFGRFGNVTLYRTAAPPSEVVLFLSGDGGWNLGVVDMARSLAGLGALVAGIDITHYLKELGKGTEPCLYPAADLEALSKFVQYKSGMPSYIPPTLVGYSSGATLAYAVLVQAPATEFKGAISLGFCPDLDLPKPLCRGSGLEWRKGARPGQYVFAPSTTLEVPWIALQGLDDKACLPAVTEDFVRRTRNADIVLLAKVGHGFLYQQNWLPQFKQSFARIMSAPPVEQRAVMQSLEDLPLVEVPAKGPDRDLLAVLITGDGGWAVADRGLSEELAAAGIPVVGLNSLKYFWTKRTPESAAADLQRILRRYLPAWRKSRVVLIGYSLGADVLPFMMNRLPDEDQAAVSQVVLIGPSENVEFEFHVLDWLGRPAKDALPVAPEVARIKADVKILCVFGERDTGQICGKLDPGRVARLALPGSHRMGSGFSPVAAAILEALKRPIPASPEN